MGGPGDDTFFFDDFYASGTLGDDADIIQDFAQGDLIDVSAIDASQGGAGDQRFTFIGNDAFSGASSSAPPRRAATRSSWAAPTWRRRPSSRSW